MITIAALFIATTVQFNLPPDLLSSICYIESKHNHNAMHMDDGGSPSIGICQIKFKTAKWLGYKGTAEGLLDPKTNIHYSGKYLAYQLRRYKSNSRAVVAYNFGNATSLTSSAYQRKVFSIWKKK